MTTDMVKECKPEFVELLDALRIELNVLDNNSIDIHSKVKTIKDFSEPEMDNSKEKPDPIGVLDELWMCVHRLREYNNTLSEARHGLSRLVG